MRPNVELAKNAGGKIAHRRVPLEQFVTGPNQTALQDGELLIAVECDALARTMAAASRRSAIAVRW